MDILASLNPAVIFALLSIILAVLNLLLWIMVWNGSSGSASMKEDSGVGGAVKNLSDRLDENMERNLRLEDQIWGIIDKFKEQEKTLQSIKSDLTFLKGADPGSCVKAVENIREDVLQKLEGVLLASPATGTHSVENEYPAEDNVSEAEDILTGEGEEGLPEGESEPSESADILNDVESADLDGSADIVTEEKSEAAEEFENESPDLSESADILDDVEQEEAEILEETPAETFDLAGQEDILDEDTPSEDLTEVSDLDDILDEELVEETPEPSNSESIDDEADDSIKNINFNLEDLEELRDEDLGTADESGESAGLDIPDLIEDDDLSDKDEQ